MRAPNTHDVGFVHLQSLWEQANAVWLAGGWAMAGIAAVGLVMFGVGCNVWLGLQGAAFRSVPESTWRRWIEHPRERRGPIGELIDRATALKDLKDTASLFEHLRATETAPFERDLRVMKVCVGAAPLVGLLGTVTGMLVTFGALSSGSGGQQTMTSIAGGISEALITTETGLVIALPGLFVQYQLARKTERYRALLAHLESLCTQAVYKRQRAHSRRASSSH